MANVLGNCVICCYSCRPDKIAALPCGHTFHYDCVLQWVQNSKTCPSCRVRCIERNIIKTLFFNTDLDSTISPGEEELDSVKKELFDKKRECEEMAKKLTSAQAEAAVNLKERARWQKRAEEGDKAVRVVDQLRGVIADQSEIQRENKELKAKLKASRFYQLLVTGENEERLNKFITNDGKVNVDHFIILLQKQVAESGKKLKEEQRRRGEVEASIAKYKRLVQELRGGKSNEELEGRLERITNEKRLSFGGMDSPSTSHQSEFTDSFLGSAMRPAPKGRMVIGGKKEEDEKESNTIFDTRSAERRRIRGEESPEIDAFDEVRMNPKVVARLGHKEKMSNGMGREFSMKRPTDRLFSLPEKEKENRSKPYDRVVPKKKVVAPNARLSSFFQKQDKKRELLDETICID